MAEETVVRDGRKCGNCLFYNAKDGICEIKQREMRAENGPCSQWEDWEDDVR